MPNGLARDRFCCAGQRAGLRVSESARYRHGISRFTPLHGLGYGATMPIEFIWRRLFWVGVCLAASCISVWAQDAAPPAPTDAPMVLHISANEVVLDVVARDKNNNSVGDLAESEFDVSEPGRHGADKTPRRILSMRVIDPRKDASRAGANEAGFRISSGATCALNATTHYELAIQASQEPGFHQVVMKTTRQGVKLSFRHRYYVGPTAVDETQKKSKANADGLALGDAACFHSLTPPTLAVSAHPFAVPGANVTRYAVVVRPTSLAAIGINGVNTRAQLDFGMCTFDATGGLVQYMHSSSDRQLDAAALEKAQTRGLVNLLEIPGAQPPDLARLVVRDRVTGNLGIVDVARPVTLAAQADHAKALQRPVGSIRSFGSVTPRDNTFCGDVYELSSGASQLPEFWNIEPVGSVYTDTLNVIEQDITGAEGLPGVTRSNTWFGVDYYGEFFIPKAGEYGFELQSDDGSRLEIDNQLIIENDGVHTAQAKGAHVTLAAGRHTVHVPYFQGPPTSLALMLRIRPPGESMRPFNLGEFAPTASAAQASSSAH